MQRAARLLRLGVAVSVLAAALSATDASAQAPETRPYQAAFGGASREPSRKKSLGVGFLVEQARGQMPPNNAGSGFPEAINGAFSTFGTFSRFDWRGRRVQFGASGSTNLRYYGGTGELTSEHQELGAGLSAQFGSTSLFLNQSMTYTPAYLNGLTATPNRESAGAVASPGADMLLDNARAFVHVTDANVSKRIGARGTASAFTHVQFTNFRGASSAVRGLTTYDVGGSFTQGLTRDVGLVLGYEYRQAAFADGTRPVEHRLNTGIDYHKTLSITRRTTFTSSVGSSILGAPTQSVNGTGIEDNPRQNSLQLRATGQLVHQLGRTWRLSGVFKREVNYVEELGSPVLTNGWTLDAGGFVNRRMDITASATYSSGTDAYTGQGGFYNYTANARTRIAIARSVAFTADYYLYAHDFNRAALTPGVPTKLTQSIIRAGLSLWLPLVQR